MNLKLISLIQQVSKKTKIKFSLKLHPSLDVRKYHSLANKFGFMICSQSNNLSEELETGKYDFAISFNSTSYYEAMYYGLICFRYKYENDILFGLNDKFGDSEELLAMINKYKALDVQKLTNQVQDILNKMLGNGVNNYSRILTDEDNNHI